jgi:hypothetical protein
MKIAATSFILFATLLSLNVYSQNKADDIAGIWLTGAADNMVNYTHLIQKI